MHCSVSRLGAEGVSSGCTPVCHRDVESAQNYKTRPQGMARGTVLRGFLNGGSIFTPTCCFIDDRFLQHQSESIKNG